MSDYRDLKDWMEQNPHKGFRPAPRYCEDGDYMTYFDTDERCRARRIDELVTVYESRETGEIIGCKIKGVRLLLEKAENLKSFFGLVVTGDTFTIGVLFVSAALLSNNNELLSVGERFKTTEIPKTELPTMAA